MLVHRRANALMNSASEPAVGSGSGAPLPEGLDASAIARLRELDPTGQARLIERVVDAYLGSADRLAQQLRQAQASGDAASVRMVAHTLKSSSASVGALTLSKQCADTEALVRDRGIVPELDGAVQALLHQLDSALHALRALRSGRTE